MKRILSLAVLLALCVTSCSREPKTPNLVLITVDTLRPDRLGFNGAAHPTSPTIDRLAREGVVFSNATSVAGWTLPSMATIFTGQNPKDHGAVDFHWSLDTSLPTLAGVLREHGYDTYGFVSHIMLTPTYGMGDGFAHFDFSVLNVGHPHEVMTSQKLMEIARKGMRNLKQPYFVWIHFFDPHFAYLEHPQYAFGKADIDRYDAEIAYTDYYIDELLKVTDKGNTVVVFTADHGEEFGEHGGQYHYTLHGEVMRVPAIIKAPGLTPRTDARVVEQVDFLPTILNLLGVEAPDNLPGRDMLAPEQPARPVYLERDRPPQWRQRAIVSGNHKLIVVEDADISQVPESGRSEEIEVTNVQRGMYLYDLSRDPGEKTNLFARDDSTSLALLGMLTTHFASASARPQPVQVDNELLEKLRSLGYVK